jgi:hypothetical protein
MLLDRKAFHFLSMELSIMAEDNAAVLPNSGQPNIVLGIMSELVSTARIMLIPNVERRLRLPQCFRQILAKTAVEIED